MDPLTYMITTSPLNCETLHPIIEQHCDVFLIPPSSRMRALIPLLGHEREILIWLDHYIRLKAITQVRLLNNTYLLKIVTH